MSDAAHAPSPYLQVARLRHELEEARALLRECYRLIEVVAPNDELVVRLEAALRVQP
jgi:hypothetical protein